MKTSQILIKALKFMAKGFCKWFAAEDAEGHGINPLDRKAVKWCAGGAVMAATLTDSWPWASDPLNWLTAAAGKDIVTFNNAPKRTKAEMLEVFDTAIFMAKLEEAAA